MNLREFHPKNPDVEMSLMDVCVLSFMHAPSLFPSPNLGVSKTFTPPHSIDPFLVVNSGRHDDPEDILNNTVRPLLERTLFGQGPILVYAPLASYSWLIINVTYLAEVQVEEAGSAFELRLLFLKGTQGFWAKYTFWDRDQVLKIQKELLEAVKALEEYLKDFGLEIPE